MTTCNPFVVYVNYPNSIKEYAYRCTDPTIKQGSTVYNARGVACVVVRTANEDPLAERMVWSRRQPLCPPAEVDPTIKAQKDMIQKRLSQLARQDTAMKRWTELAKTNPEAKKLLATLKGLL